MVQLGSISSAIYQSQKCIYILILFNIKMLDPMRKYHANHRFITHSINSMKTQFGQVLSRKNDHHFTIGQIKFVNSPVYKENKFQRKLNSSSKIRVQTEPKEALASLDLNCTISRKTSYRFKTEKQQQNVQNHFTHQYQSIKKPQSQWNQQARRSLQNRSSKQSSRLNNITSQSIIISAKNSGEKNRLIQALMKQIQLDEELRFHKYAFLKIKDANKMRYINTYQPIKDQQIRLTEEEYDPFYTPRETNADYQAIASSLRYAQNHWNQQIMLKFSWKRLEQCGFTADKLSRNDMIKEEDMVTYLSFESKRCLRKRDVILIHRRFSKNASILTFADLLKIICYDI